MKVFREMKETDNIKMEIKIAGDSLYLTVPFLKQNQVREAERRVGDLFQLFMTRYPGMNPRQVLAMVAYELSSRYGELLRQTDSAIQQAENIESTLKELIAIGNRKAQHMPYGADSADSAPAEEIEEDRSNSESDNFYTSY